MKLKFKEQQYQLDAVQSVVDCFVGQPKTQSRRDIIARYQKTHGEGIFEETTDVELLSFGNTPIALSNDTVRTNIHNVQKHNNLHLTDTADTKQFSIEMETGTGKTYTYIRTMYELNKEYGWSKFIVMVPSIAIREGVYSSFQATEDHFQAIYNKKIRCVVYNSQNTSNIANINSYASDDAIQVIIMNYQAFNTKSKANKRIYEELDELQSQKPIDIIKSVHPILIMDEPQKIGDNTEELLAEFNPLFTLRYSATHKKDKEYNKVYQLDAVDAYNQQLVKKISVKGIEILNAQSEKAFLYLEDVILRPNKDPEAKLGIEIKTSSGTSKRTIRVSKGTNLYERSGELTEYKGYVVNDIDATHAEYNRITFTNGIEIHGGQVVGEIDPRHLARIQIRETIKSHLEKEQSLFEEGIKVLSLFFLDEVKNYKYYEEGVALKGDYAQFFEEEYTVAINDLLKNQNLSNAYRSYLTSFETGKIHNGYFSIDKKGQEVNPKINDKKAEISFDENAYDLIMKDKERLLSLDEQVRFIFSHSALREGWDNPNIFQICTLRQGKSEMSKRQEIGRGLRICVNKDGERMDSTVLETEFHTVNNLTVIANESYTDFSKSLQDEISKELSHRPMAVTTSVFLGKTLSNKQGDRLTFYETEAMDLILNLKENAYLDSNYKVTDKFRADFSTEKVILSDKFKPYQSEILNIVNEVDKNNNFAPITNATKENIRYLEPNENFNKQEFQDLWNKIKVKTIYQVNFDTAALINEVITTINSELQVSKITVQIITGEQKQQMTKESLSKQDSMIETSMKNDELSISQKIQTKYDLVGELTKDTGLTRKSVIRILKGISSEKFDYFKINPEEFIRKTSKIINSNKAKLIIDKITYHKTDDEFSNEVFIQNNVNGRLNDNALAVKRHIYDYLVTDSNTELNFAKDLEIGEVSVYAKLPPKFKIPTPVGNYNPDWAVVYNKDTTRYIYFIAETKGSGDSGQLRETEKAKIDCAKKHFASISNNEIQYGVITNYKQLREMIEG